MNPESYRPRNRPQPQNTAEGHQPPSNLNKDKHNRMSIKRKVAAAVLSILTIAGLAHAVDDSRQGINPVKTAEIQRPNSDESNVLKIDSLSVGSEASYAEGIYQLDPDKLNIRKSAQVRDTEGESNRWNISSGSFVVVNPALADSSNTGYGDSANGPWYVAVDSTGEEYFFVGNRGGITNLETGEVVKNLGANLGSGKIIATTTKGNVVKNNIGENELIATITQG